MVGHRPRDELDPTRSDAGFSLPVVLWSLLLAALLVVTFLAASRTSIRIAANSESHAGAAALAEAGVSIAILDLVDAARQLGARRRIPVDGEAVTCRLEADAILTLVVEDEAGKIDINQADEILLQYLLVGTGSSPGEANRLAARILDYRDADELRHLNGAERDDYRRAGRTTGPSDGPFLTTEELAQVLGMPVRAVDRLLPFVTIDSGLAGIDPQVAPRSLIETLYRGVANAADLSLPADAASARAGLPLPAAYRVYSPGSVFLIRAIATLPNGAEAEAAAIAELTPGAGRAYQIRRWIGAAPSRESSRSTNPKPRSIGTC